MTDRNPSGQPTHPLSTDSVDTKPIKSSSMSAKLTDEQVLQRRDTLEMMRRPHLWPQYPLLPLRVQGVPRRIGLLFHAGMLSSGDLDLRFLDGANMLLVTVEQFASAPQADIRQLVNDGWVVD